MTKKQLEKFLNKTKKLTKTEQVEFVNDHVNSNLTYESDMDQFGVVDQWPALKDLVDKDIKYLRDDCDGYAILKYSLLSQLGFSDYEIGMMIFVKDDKLYAHMTTAWFQTEEEVFILDYGVVFPKSGAYLLSEVSDEWTPVAFFNKSKLYSIEETR